jgi:hypothetical protein
VARALERVPQAVEWYLEEDWRPSERTHRAIRAVLSSEAQPRKPRSVIDPQIGDLDAILVPGDPARFGVGDPVNVGSSVQPIHSVPITLALENISDVPAIITDISGSSRDFGRLTVRHPASVQPHATATFECWVSTISSATRYATRDVLALEVRYYEGGSSNFASLTMSVRYEGSGIFALDEWNTERVPVEPSKLETQRPRDASPVKGAMG